jgi:hypothetical protein
MKALHATVLAAVSAALLMGLTGQAHAAAVTWGAAQNVSGVSNVSTAGTLVNAWNFGSALGTTVNGVMFSGVSIAAAPPQVLSHTFGPHTLSTFDERPERTLINFGTGASPAAGTFFGALSPAYQALLSDSAGTNFGDRETDLRLGGLTVGTTYEFQVWFNDSGTAGEFGFGLEIGDLLGNSAYLEPSVQTDVDGDYILGGTGQWVVGSFTADATHQDLMFVRGEIGGGINGFQLRQLDSPPPQVPLPGTLVLTGAALLAAAGASRRARAPRD